MCTTQVWVCDCLWPGQSLLGRFSWPLLSNSPGEKHHHVWGDNQWPSNQAIKQPLRTNLGDGRRLRSKPVIKRLCDPKQDSVTSVRFPQCPRDLSALTLWPMCLRTGLGPLRSARCPTVALAVACLQHRYSCKCTANKNAINSPQTFSLICCGMQTEQKQAEHASGPACEPCIRWGACGTGERTLLPNLCGKARGFHWKTWQPAVQANRLKVDIRYNFNDRYRHRRLHMFTWIFDKKSKGGTACCRCVPAKKPEPHPCWMSQMQHKRAEINGSMNHTSKSVIKVWHWWLFCCDYIVTCESAYPKPLQPLWPWCLTRFWFNNLTQKQI